MLKLTNIKKSYKTFDFTQVALNDVTITFRENEFAAILGTSGSGKTTLLNIVGGLDQYDHGDIEIDGVSTKQYKSKDWDAYRNNRIGFVFQSYNLIPHQTVLANVELALTISGISKSERKERARQALDEVGLIDHVRKLPSQLSGGQMQRVAIARALINNPEIVLADEPTGALDSSTSEQVMELLSKIAKDRLVIMVTHNPALADEYANRIIELKDGVVINDSNPVSERELSKVEAKKAKEVGMSFWTAISLSLSNLMTKKGRTFVTALAGSIGIIGIAAILALASGINAYIAGIEEETMTNYPLTIQSSGIDIGSLMNDSAQDLYTHESSDDESVVSVQNVFDTMFNFQNKNDLASLKKHIDSTKKKIGPYVKNIKYTYDITPEIFLKNSKVVDQVSPDSIMKEFGFGPPEGMSAIMGGMSSGMNNFNELPGDLSLYESQYDVKVGRWPQKYDEAVVVLMGDGSVSDYTLYSLGLRDRQYLKERLNNLVNNPGTVIGKGETDGTFPIEDLLTAQLSVINPAGKYTFDKEYNLWLDKSDSESHMKGLIEEGINLKIVGVVIANGQTTASMLSPGIYYEPSLITTLMEMSNAAQIVQDQLKNPLINVFTGKTFIAESEAVENDFNFASMFSIDEKALQNAFVIDSSKIKFDIPKFELDINSITIPPLDIEGISNELGSILDVPSEFISDLIKTIITDFLQEQTNAGITDPAEIIQNLPLYLNRPDVQQKIKDSLDGVVDFGALSKEITEVLERSIGLVIQGSVDSLMTSLQNEIKSQMTSAMSDLPKQFQNAISFNQSAFMNAFKLKVGEEDILDLITAMMGVSQSTFENNLKKLGYADVENPIQISLYPKDFTTKENVIHYLQEYNEGVARVDETKVVRYTDLVGTLMSSVTDIVDTISYALIAFVAISLVVSSIMIGVITYVSVLERKKEIGILRAIGASKRDIRLVFNAETLIIGFIAGILGVGVTYIISFIGSAIVYNILGIANIAQLPIQAAVVLVAISMFLALVAGLFPSSAAARKDPVEALRSE